MARTALTVQEVTLSGLSPTFSAANADGNSFANDGDTFLYVKNGGASSITVTIITPAKEQGVDIEDITVTIAASGEKMIGPFPRRLFNYTDGVHVDYSAVTSVTVAAIKV